MRGKKAILSSLAAIGYEIVNIISAFIVPKLILSQFGSSNNGLTAAIVQFLNCIILLRAGVAGVTRFALYKPLSENDNKKVSEILLATNIFMKKISLIFTIIVVVFASIYPKLVEDDFGWLYTFSLIIIIGFGVIIQNCFSVPYQILLMADQKRYIYSFIQIIAIIMNTIITIILIKFNYSLHIIKFASALAYMIIPIFINIYVRKKYEISKNVKADFIAIKQRWHAFAQEVAVFVNNNTDLMILSLFSNVREISVYTVYYLVVNGIRAIILAIASGGSALLGNIVAKSEKENLKKIFRLYELNIYSIAVILFTSSGILIVAFIQLYTKGINDANYQRPLFGIMISLCNFFYCIRIPYHDLAEAAGHFKETKKGAIIESIINIVVSILLVIRLGLIGVAIGTLCAMTFRMIQYSRHTSKYILKRPIREVVGMNMLAFLEAITIILILKILPSYDVENYIGWINYATIVFLVSTTVVLFYKYIFFKKEVFIIGEKIINIIRKKAIMGE